MMASEEKEKGFEIKQFSVSTGWSAFHFADTVPLFLCDSALDVIVTSG